MSKLKPNQRRLSLVLSERTFTTFQRLAKDAKRSMPMQLELMVEKWEALERAQHALGAPARQSQPPKTPTQPTKHPLWDEGRTDDDWWQEPIQLVENNRGLFDIYKVASVRVELPGGHVVANQLYAPHVIVLDGGLFALDRAQDVVTDESSRAIMLEAANYRTVALRNDNELWDFVDKHKERFDLPA